MDRVMFARENVGTNIAISLRNDIASFLSLALSLSLCSARLPRATLEIEINSSLPGVRV